MSEGSDFAITISDDDEEGGHHVGQRSTNHEVARNQPGDLFTADLNQQTSSTLVSSEHPIIVSALLNNQSATDLKSRPLKKRYTEAHYVKQFIDSVQKNDSETDILCHSPLRPEHSIGFPDLLSQNTFQVISPLVSLCPQNGIVYSRKDGVYYQRIDPTNHPSKNWMEMPKSQAQLVQQLTEQQEHMMQHLIKKQEQLKRIEQPFTVANAQQLSVGSPDILDEKNIQHAVQSCTQRDRIMESQSSKSDGNQPKMKDVLEKVVHTSYELKQYPEKEGVSRVSTQDSVINESVEGHDSYVQTHSGEEIRTDNPDTATNQDAARDSDSSCNLTILETFSLRDCPLSDKYESEVSSAMNMRRTLLTRHGSHHFRDQNQNDSFIEESAAGLSQTETQEQDVDIKPFNACPLDELSRKSFYQCCIDFCTHSTVTPTEFENHLANVHPNSDVYMCVHCGHSAASGKSLIEHLHDHVRDDSDKVTLTCSYSPCSFKTVNPDDLLRHIHLNHQNAEYHMCCRCDKVFENVLDLLMHMKGNFLSVVKCPHCTAKDVTKKNIICHINQNHPGKGKILSVSRYIICKDRSLTQWPFSLSVHLQTVISKSPHKLSQVNSDSESTDMPNLSNDCYPRASEDPVLIQFELTKSSDPLQDFVPIMSGKVDNPLTEVEKITSRHDLSDSNCQYTDAGSAGTENISSSINDGRMSLIKTEPQDSGYDFAMKQEIKQEPMDVVAIAQRTTPHCMSPTTTSKSLLQRVNVCNKCDFYTASNGAIYRHLKIVHKIDDMFQCSECLQCVAQDDVIEHHTKYHPSADENYVPTTLNHGYRIKYMQKSDYKAELKKRKMSKDLNDDATQQTNPVQQIATGLLERFNNAKEGDVVKLSSLESSLFEQILKTKKMRSSGSRKASTSASDKSVQQVAHESTGGRSLQRPLTKKIRRKKSGLGIRRKKKRKSPELKPESRKRSRCNDQNPGVGKSRKTDSSEMGSLDIDSQTDDDAEQFQGDFDHTEHPKVRLETSEVREERSLQLRNSIRTTRSSSSGRPREGCSQMTQDEPIIASNPEMNGNDTLKHEKVKQAVVDEHTSVGKEGSTTVNSDQLIPEETQGNTSVRKKSHMKKRNSWKKVTHKKTKTIKVEAKSPKKVAVEENYGEQVGSTLKKDIKTQVKKIKFEESTGPDLTFSQVNFDDPAYEFRCKYCTYRRGNLDKFLHHTYYHFHYRPYACGFCSYKAFSHNRVLTHIGTDHPSKVKTPVVKRVENEKAEARCQKTAMICFIPKHIEDVTLRIRLEKKKEKLKLKKLLKKEQGGEPSIKKEHQLKKEPKKLKSKIRKGQAKLKSLRKPKTEGSYLCPYCRTNRPLMTWTKLVIEICYHIHYKPFTCSYCSACDTASTMCLQRHIEKSHPKKEVVVTEQRDPAKELRLKQLLQRSVDLSKKHRQELKLQELKLKGSKGKKKKKTASKIVSEEAVKTETSVTGQSAGGPPETSEVVGEADSQSHQVGSDDPQSVSVSDVNTAERDDGASTNETTQRALSPQDKEIKTSEQLFRKVWDDYGQTLYECLECDYTIRNLKSMYTHSYKHQPKVFKCAYCDVTSYPRSAVAWHQKKFHCRLKTNVINLATVHKS